ncbi:MAG: transglycosylase SLT domain-containing protein [Acidobacteriia bacterium]|nr:transglycosylase SLT domain-containing protein [Terriglobia bacterium]
MSFLPPMPRGEAFSAELTQAPALEPNVYLQNVPLLAPPLSGPRKPRSEALVQRADQAFQRGKRYYQANDIASARQEFDRAVDLMLEASAQNPSDRQEYEKRFDEMIDAIHRFDLAGLGASAEVQTAGFEKAPLEDLLQMTFPVDPKLKDKVREQVAATVSELPLVVTDPVLGYIHFFDTRGKKTLLAGIERSGRYRPMIQRILDEEGIPPELIHLAQAESGFIPRAVSYKAAGGMWQFLTWRGRQYGLMQTKYTDDRMDPERATRAAARHLHDLYNEFGDWYLALAAYNCGPGVVEKAVERTGYADFWELRNRGVLPLETTNYVPIILAMTIMEKNAAEYGLKGAPLDPPLEYDTIETTVPTSLALLADLADAPLAELQSLNPAVLRDIAPENYAVHVPKSTGDLVMASLQLVPAEHRTNWRIHHVSAGETLASIGKRYGVPVATLMAANRFDKSEMAEGDRVILPLGGRVNSSPAQHVTRIAQAKSKSLVRKNHANSALVARTSAQ